MINTEWLKSLSDDALRTRKHELEKKAVKDSLTMDATTVHFLKKEHAKICSMLESRKRADERRSYK